MGPLRTMKSMGRVFFVAGISILIFTSVDRNVPRVNALSKSDFALTGSVIKVVPVLPVKRFGGVEIRHPQNSTTLIDRSGRVNPGRLLFDLAISLQYRNDSDKPLLIINPRNFLNGRRIEFSRIQSDGSEIRISSTPIDHRFFRFGYSFDPRDGLPAQLDRRSPQESPDIIVIEPGRFYSFIDHFYVDSGFAIDTRPGEKQSDVDLESRRITSEFQSFIVEYQLDLNNRKGGADLLKTLQLRWKSFGDLPLRGTNFFVRSEPIVIRDGD